jgi:hypothetical protein
VTRVATVLSAGLAAAAHAQSLFHLENFDGGTNAAQWTFGVPTQTAPTTGGYPCCNHLRSGLIEGAVPMVGTTLGTTTPFTGDYRAAGITSAAAYMKVNSTNQVPSTVRPAVLLYSANGTPSDLSDDWGAFRTAVLPLPPLGQWQMCAFGVPSQQATLPTGWTIVRLGPAAPVSPDWNVLIQNVDRLMFSYGNPSQSGKGQSWDVSADYIFITAQPYCYPNCDGSSIAPCLNVNDFTCFLNRFANGDGYANCDGSTTTPVHNVGDFSCFLMMFANGCSAC